MNTPYLNTATIIPTLTIAAWAYRQISKHLQKKEVLAAVQRDGRALNYVSPELKADKEVVLAAVQENAGALEHASLELRADREVVLAAVRSDGWARGLDDGPRSGLESRPLLEPWQRRRWPLSWGDGKGGASGLR